MDRRLIGWPAAAHIEILDAQKKARARTPRPVERGQRRKGVAQMEKAGGRGREACGQNHKANKPFGASCGRDVTKLSPRIGKD